MGTEYYAKDHTNQFNSITSDITWNGSNEYNGNKRDDNSEYSDKLHWIQNSHLWSIHENCNRFTFHNITEAHIKTKT